jgi:hypothetical protein
MSIFDMGKNTNLQMDKAQREFMESNSVRRYDYLPGGYRRYADNTATADEVRAIIVELERTALELRELIGEG